MILTIPFHYYASALLPGKQKNKRILVRDSVPVEIAEIDDAALVARVPQSETSHETEYFWKDGVFWSTFEYEEGHRHVPVEPGFMLECLAENRDVYGMAPLFVSGEPIMYRENGLAFDSLEDARPRQIEDSTREDVVGDIQRRASRYAIVGGKAVRAVKEPVLRTWIDQGRGIEVRGKLRFVVDPLPDDFTNKGIEAYWRLDKLEAMKKARGKFLERYDLSGAEPEVYRPDLLVWNRERVMLQRRLTADFESIVEPRMNGLRDLSVECFAAYADIRDALPAIEAGDEEALRLAGAAAVRFREAGGYETSSSGPFHGSAELYVRYLEEVDRELADDQTMNISF